MASEERQVWKEHKGKVKKIEEKEKKINEKDKKIEEKDRMSESLSGERARDKKDVEEKDKKIKELQRLVGELRRASSSNSEPFKSTGGSQSQTLQQNEPDKGNIPFPERYKR